MATGFAEAQRMNPLPKQDVQPITAFPPAPEQYEEAPRVIPFSEIQARDILGPQNPLEGPTNPDDIAGIVTGNRLILQVLQKTLVAVRNLHPSMPLVIKEESGSGFTLGINGVGVYKFFIDKKPVPSLWTRVDNISGVTIWVGLDDQPSNQNIPVLNNTSAVFPIEIGYLSIQNGNQAGVVVNGLSDTRGAPTQGANYIVLTAYGNPEWTDVWGQTS